MITIQRHVFALLTTAMDLLMSSHKKRLKNLEQKGFVARDRSLGVHLFSAIVGREEYGGRQLESLAEKLTGGSIAPLLTHLIDEKKLDKAEIKRLRKLLEEAHKP